MEKEYTRMFSIAKLYELIKGDTSQIEVSPFETLNINRSFHIFSDKWLPEDINEHDKATAELDNIMQEIEENAFCVGFKMAVNLRAPLKTSAIYLHYAFCRHIAQNFFGIRQYACKNFEPSANKIRSTSKRHRFLEMPLMR